MNHGVARTKFAIGDRVQFTGHARKSFARTIDRRPDYPTVGTVRGFSRRSFLVRVQRDNRRGTETWHMDFWEGVST